MTAQPTPPKRCACGLAPVATKEEHAAAHAAGKCAMCYDIEALIKIRLGMKVETK
jgi:hypothetical protein